MDAMLSSAQPSDARFQKFSKIFRETLKENEHLKNAIKNLTEDVKISKSTHSFLKKEILKKLASQSQTVEHAKLLAKINELEKEIQQHKTEQNKIQQQFLEEKQHLQAEVAQEKLAHSETESRLKIEMQLASDVAAMQYDELELKMEQRLSDVTMQLRESNSTCNVLRGEIFSLKQRLASNNSEEKVKRLEERLMILEEQLRTAHRMLEERDRKQEVISSCKRMNESRYTPLKVVEETTPSFNQCFVTEKQARMAKKAKNEALLPPLRPLAESKTSTESKSFPRKRKLFDPNNFDYYENIKKT